MIDKIVEMILTEARDRPGDDYLENLYSVWDPIRDKVHLEMVEAARNKWRENRNKEIKEI